MSTTSHVPLQGWPLRGQPCIGESLEAILISLDGDASLIAVAARPAARGGWSSPRGERRAMCGRVIDDELVALPNRVAPSNPSDPNMSSNRKNQQEHPGVPTAAAAEIAIVGMACRFPDANDPETFWNNMMAGKVSIGEIPAERWDWRAYWGDSKTEDNKTHSKWGAFIDGVDLFDAELFGISPREAENMDPQQRVMLEVCWSCLEDAGMTPAGLTTRNVGVYVSVFNYDYKELLEQEPRVILAHHATGCSPAIVANRISYHFDLCGPSSTVDTACSGSLHALHLAVQALREHECDMALVGGVNLLLTPTRHISFAKTGMLSPTGRCCSFDEKADGYVRGEGAGAVLLMPLAKAMQAGHRIYGVLRGSAVNHGGKAFTLTHPSSQGQSEVIYRAWARSGLSADDIDYIEAHGTGTPKGDPIEWEGLNRAFERLAKPGQSALRGPRRALGTVKANIGHLEAAAGIAGLIKVLLALQHDCLPRLATFTRLNPRIDAAASAFYPLADTVAWAPRVSPDGTRCPRRAGVSSFGFGGTNAHVVVEEFIDPRPRESHARTGNRRPALILLSARNEERLHAAARNLLDHLRRDLDGSAGDLERMAYTLQVGRVAMRERLAIAVTSPRELAEKLQAFLAGQQDPGALFRGRSRREGGAPGESAADAALAGAGAEYVAHGTYPTLLERWVNGAEVDWNLLYGAETPLRVSLPTYPFARERHWKTDRKPDVPRNPTMKRQDTLLLQPMWQDRNVSDSAREPRYIKRCVLLCGAGDGDHERLTDELRGASIVTLASTGETIERRFQEYAARLLQELQNLQPPPPQGWMLLQVVVPSGADGIFLPALAGMLKSAQQENPKLLWQLIETGAAGAALAAVLRQNGRAPQDRHIRYHRGQRQVAGWLELEQERGEVPWKHGGVYLITGGAGGLGLILAREILRRTKGAHIILVGRRALQAGDVEQLDLLQQEAAALDRASVFYRAVDVTEQAAVTDLIVAVRNEFGQLNGIIHGAGVIRDGFIRNKDQRELQAVLGPKVAGLLHLDRATQGLELDVFVLLSSVSGSMGNVGQADYAAANAFLDIYAHHRSQQVADGRRHGHTVSINWPLWRDGGMKIAAGADTALRQSNGMEPLQTEAGLDAFYRAVASRQAQVMVLAGERSELRRWLDESQAMPELESAEASGAALDSPELRQKVLQRLKQLLGGASQLPVHQIDAEEPLESYGIDSILIAQLNAGLETVFTGLSKTLFFEFQTLIAVADHLVASHPQSCMRWVGLADQMQAGLTVTEGAARRTSPAPATLPPPALAHVASGTRLVDAHPNRDAVEPIAIIGMSGRYPGAANLAEFWDNLRAGRDCIAEIPPDRWPLADFFVADKRAAMVQGKSYSKWGGFVDKFADFEPLFFNIAPREAYDMDPQERLFIETCWATFEDAGYGKKELLERCDGRVGVFVGITKTGFDLHGPDLWRRGKLQNPQTSFSSVANRISYLLNLNGPSMAIDTMCSASLTAIHEACLHIHREDCDMAIAGGVNLYVHPASYIRLCAQQMLATDGRCKSFGAGGDGFVPGEGVGAILLKRLSAAQRDGDQIYGLILGTSINHGGKTNGYTVPSPVAQAHLVRQALDRAGVNARQVSYIEAHGTGTKLGDPIEIRGLQQAYERDTQDRQFCAIGSVKSNVGHLEAAAGIVGVTKVLLQIHHRTLVPSLHAQTLNPNIDFSDSPFVVQRELGEWRRPVIRHDGEAREYPRIAGISSFGAGGSNAHVILAEYEDTPLASNHRSEGAGTDGLCAILLSARDDSHLKTMAGNLARHLRVHRDALGHRLHDIAYTLQVGRDAMDERLAIMATSYMQAEEKLRRFADGEENVEDLYHGQVRANKELQAVFQGDEDMARTLELWLMKGKYDKLLGLWVKGVEIDWRRLYVGNHPRRVSLPTYAFAGNTYWLPSEPGPAGTPAHSSRWLHPLVQSNTSTFAGQEFTSLLSGREFFLADHRVQGQRVLPGVAYLEMARAASALSGLGPIAGLRNVLWASMLRVEDVQKVSIRLTKAQDRIKYQIATVSDTGEEIHGQGSVIPAMTGSQDDHKDAHEPGASDLAEIEARCRVTFSDSEIYAHFHGLGLDYGVGFQALRQIRCSEHEVLATYRLPASVAEGFSDFVLHPSIMDAALQALIGFEMLTGPEHTRSRHARVPFSVHSVDLLRQLPPEGYVHAQRVVTAAGSNLFTYDVRVLDQDGVSCVAMQQFTLRPMHGEKQALELERRVTSPSLDQVLLATPHWRAQSLGAAVSTPPLSGVLADVLVLWVNGNLETAGRLAARLGCRVEILALDEQHRIDEAAVSLVKRVFDELKSLLRGDHDKNSASSARAIYVLMSDRLDRRVAAPLAALLATARQENAKPQGRLVMIPDEHRAAVDMLCSIIRGERNSNTADLEVLYCRNGERLTKQWSEMAIGARAVEHAATDAAHAPLAGRPVIIKDGGVYWITGGMGGLGKLFAEHLLSLANVSIVLSGRSALTDTARRYLDTLEKPGCTIEYRQSDVGDAGQVQAMVDHIRRRYGALDGIIHSAGALQDGLIVGKSANAFDQAFMAKARGVEYIDHATGSMDLDFFLLCSSMAAVVGNVGQADYGSANAYLDAFAHARNAMVLGGERRGVTLSVNWPLWKDGGMRMDARAEARFARRTGISPLATRDGLAALDAMLAAGLSGQVLVLSGDRDKIRASLAITTPPGSSDEQPAMKTPDVLSLQTSPIEDQLLELYAELLQIEKRELDPNSEFSEYGMDSIQMMHMLNRLEGMYEVTLDPSAIANYPTTKLLARYLLDEGTAGQEGMARARQQPDRVKPADERSATRPTARPSTSALEEQLLNLCAELLQIEKRELDRDSDFSEYGMDSIQMMHMLNRLEDMYEVTLDPSAIANHSTISLLARYLIDEGTEEREAAGEASRDSGRRGTAGGDSADTAPSAVPARHAVMIRQWHAPSSSDTSMEKVAIIGQAGRFPQSPDLDTFWQHLARGSNLITEVPRDRWDMDSVFSLDRSACDKSYSRHGGFLEDIASFDAEFFGISDVEAIGMDPQHRLVLELARELFESSGYSRETLDGSRTIVLLGAKDNNYLRNYYQHLSPASLKHMIANSISNMMAARVSDFYNLKGPAKTIDTACSSSLVAVHDACRSIIAGEADLAVAGGIFLLVDPFYHIGFSRAEVLSDDDRTYVFDERAKGFVLSEGAGLVLLKRYEAALRDSDDILGVIVGSAVNNDGRTMGLTVPSEKGQMAVIEQALQSSGVTPDCIGYFEAHGTGTLLGDPIEVKAATAAYRKYTSATNYCALGSVKSNMGHSMTAAGIASLMKVLLSLRHKQIPATIHCSKPHPRFRFGDSPFYPNTALREWKPIGERRVAAITSLGFGGTNCHMIVTEP